MLVQYSCQNNLIDVRFQIDLQLKAKHRSQKLLESEATSGYGQPAANQVAVVSPLKSVGPAKGSLSLPLNPEPPGYWPPTPARKTTNLQVMTTFGTAPSPPAAVMVTSSHMVTSLDEECTTMPVHHIDMINNGQEEAFFANNKIVVMGGQPHGAGRPADIYEMVSLDQKQQDL